MLFGVNMFVTSENRRLTFSTTLEVESQILKEKVILWLTSLPYTVSSKS